MLKKLKYNKGEYDTFKKNISRLIMGSGFAQLITLLTMVFATRIYKPEDFAILGIYMATVSLLLTIFTGRLDLALIQVEDSLNYSRLLTASLILLLLNSMLYLLIVYCLYDFGLTNELKLLIFFGLCAVGFTSVYSNLYSSQQRYKEISVNRVLISIMNMIIVSLSFIIEIKNGLIIASVCSHAVISFFYVIRSNIKFYKHTLYSLKNTLKEFQDYLKIDTLSSLLNTLGRQLPLLIFPILFGSVAAGYYFFCQRLIAAPVNLIANSVGNVFRKNATLEFKARGNFKNIFFYTFYHLLGLSLILSTLVILFLEEKLFLYLFGEEWVGAINIFKIMIIFYAFKFVVSPLTYSLYIVRKLNWNFIGQLIYLLLLFTPVFIGWYKSYDFNTVVLFHVTGACIAYFFYLMISLHCACKGNDV